MSESSIICSNVSFSWSGETPLFEELSFAVGEGRTGLVAPNGAGKSTLLKLIAGEYRPSAGSVTVDGSVGYLPQTLLFVAERTVADVLGAGPVLDALNALAGGDASDEVFAAIGDQWDIEDRNPGPARPTRPWAHRARSDAGIVERRRGGRARVGRRTAEAARCAAARRADQQPRHPCPRQALRRARRLQGFAAAGQPLPHAAGPDGPHRRAAPGRHRFLWRHFSAYEESVRESQRVAVGSVRNAEQQLKREKRQMQQSRERAARRSSTAARNVKDAGLPKIIAGAMKRSAQESAGRIDGVNAGRVDDARTRLDDAERTLRDDPSIVLKLPDTAVPAGRNMFAGNGLLISRGGRALFGGGIDVSVRGPERIAITGPNGAGKTTLLRVISGQLEPDAGTIQRADGRVAYLSQRLDLLEPDRTVLDSLMAYAPNLSETRRMHLLAQFLFRGNRIHLPIATLSGGERLRATLACVLYAEPAPQLLLFDEPTNNLDLVSIGQLESALNAYRGAFVVVSHDAKFLANIRLDRTLRLP